MTSCFARFLDLMPKTRHKTLVVLFLAGTVVGCAAVPEDPKAQTVTQVLAAGTPASGEQVEPGFDRRSELIFQYLLADIAARRGDDQAAAAAGIRSTTVVNGDKGVERPLQENIVPAADEDAWHVDAVGLGYVFVHPPYSAHAPIRNYLEAGLPLEKFYERDGVLGYRVVKQADE